MSTRVCILISCSTCRISSSINFHSSATIEEQAGQSESRNDEGRFLYILSPKMLTSVLHILFQNYKNYQNVFNTFREVCTHSAFTKQISRICCFPDLFIIYIFLSFVHLVASCKDWFSQQVNMFLGIFFLLTSNTLDKDLNDVLIIEMHNIMECHFLNLNVHCLR